MDRMQEAVRPNGRCGWLKLKVPKLVAHLFRAAKRLRVAVHPSIYAIELSNDYPNPSDARGNGKQQQCCGRDKKYKYALLIPGLAASVVAAAAEEEEAPLPLPSQPPSYSSSFPARNKEIDPRTGEDIVVKPFPSRPVNGVAQSFGVVAAVLALVSVVWLHVCSAAVVEIAGVGGQVCGAVEACRAVEAKVRIGSSAIDDRVDGVCDDGAGDGAGDVGARGD
ncbi:MAG: hypothetical protein M1831_006722 [Alyxoria varia]|nr:MAG: hypothetical protein M1831_006722 [Alyxoria varia]